MAITIKDIAARAGVSRGTVDRALNNRPGVNPQVRQRIRQIAAEAGYRPNKAGRALAAKKNPMTFGIVLNSLDNPFFSQVIKGIRAASDELSDFGLQTQLIELKGYDVSSQLDAIHCLQEQNVQAIILTPVNDDRIARAIHFLTEKAIPVVTVNADIEKSSRLCYVGCDYEKSGRVAGELMGLFTQGNAHVGIVTGTVKMLGHNQRIHGFDEVVKQYYPNVMITDIVENNDDDALSLERARVLLSTHPKIDALYIVAAGVKGAMDAVTECGRRITVISFDDVEDTRILVRSGRISATICQQPFEQGYQCVKILYDYLTHGITPQPRLYTGIEVKVRQNI